MQLASIEKVITQSIEPFNIRGLHQLDLFLRVLPSLPD